MLFIEPVQAHPVTAYLPPPSHCLLVYLVIAYRSSLDQSSYILTADSFKPYLSSSKLVTQIQTMLVLLLLVETAIIGAFPQGGGDDCIGLKLGLITVDNPLGTSTPSPGGAPSSPCSPPNLEAECCCIPENQPCQPDQIGPRIFNIQSEESLTDDSGFGCELGHSACCQSDAVRAAKQNGTCVEPERWTQKCKEIVGPEAGHKQCGTRNFEEGKFLKHGEASVGEFPWTCVLLNQDDVFLGTCAIIPKGAGNDNSQGTDKVITAASKLTLQKRDLLKVRVGHYIRNDSSGSTQLPSKEYTVTRFRVHPDFDKERLTNNIAILKTQTIIDITGDFVNTVCLPSCTNQFDFTFKNGTGTRCWVMGWGDADHSKTPQKVQRKVDVPLVETGKCNNTIINTIKEGDKYAIHASEICAGGEDGKDACTGDGGSPLVCQAQSGRWTVVGLVSWGVGQCGRPGLPGVYTNIAHLQPWLQSINF